MSTESKKDIVLFSLDDEEIVEQIDPLNLINQSDYSKDQSKSEELINQSTDSEMRNKSESETESETKTEFRENESLIIVSSENDLSENSNAINKENSDGDLEISVLGPNPEDDKEKLKPDELAEKKVNKSNDVTSFEELAGKEELGKEESGKDESGKEESGKDESGKVESEQQKPFPLRKMGVSLVACICICLLCLYVYKVVVYQSIFLPGTTINGKIVQGYTASEVTNLLESDYTGYQLDVYGRNQEAETVLLGTVMPEDVNFSFVQTENKVSTMLKQQQSFFWFMYEAGFKTSQLTCQMEYVYDRDLVKQTVLNFDLLKSANMKAPENAYISGYSDDAKGFVITSEKYGNAMLISKFDEAFPDGIDFGYQAEPLHLEDEVYDIYQKPIILNDNQKLNDNLKKANKMISADLKYDWRGIDIDVDGSVISDWVSFDANYNPAFHEEKVAEYVAELANKYDSYGVERTFNTVHGFDVTISKVKYGWQVDQEATAEAMLEDIKAGKKGNREPVYTHTAYAKGEDDIGNSFVEIDLTHQHLYLHIDGAIVLESDFVSGNEARKWSTPGGLFGLTYKRQKAILRGDNYATPVDYWMPFNGNIGMHDAKWRKRFGGEIYKTDGSHGCINLPRENASQIYDYISTGFPVVCYYHEVEPAEKLLGALVGSLGQDDYSSEQEPEIVPSQQEN